MALVWWLTLQLLGLAALPLTLRLFRDLADRGWGFTRPLGLLLAAFVFWQAVTFGVLGNTRSSVLAVLLAIGAGSWIACWREGASLPAFVRRQWRQIATVELLFASAFAFFTFVRSYAPSLNQNEKPIELAFLNAVLRSERFPPLDPWLAGFSISYYYFGSVMTGVLARLAELPAQFAFNLMLPTVFALTATGAYTVGSNLCASRRAGTLEWHARAGGLLAVGLVLLVANLEPALEVLNALGVLPDQVRAFVAIKDLPAGYVSNSFFPPEPGWWSRASRVVWSSPVPPDPRPRDYTINEFPFFSFLIGDLAPHVLAMPFALVLTGFLLNALRAPTGCPVRPRLEPGAILAAGVMFGAMGFLNTWDLPTYLCLLALTLVLRGVLAARVGGLAAFGWSALAAPAAIALSLGLYAPFYRSFAAGSQAYGLRAVSDPTHATHFLVFWAPLYALTVTFLLSQTPPPAGRGVRALWAGTLLVAAGAAIRFGPVVGLTAPLLVLAAALAVRQLRCAPVASEGERLFALTLLFTGWLLVLGCELLYVHDMFGGRTNTVFKLYYQAWLLLGLAGSYMAASLLGLLARPSEGLLSARPVWRACRGALLLLFGSTLIYPVGATLDRTNAFAGERSLDGLAFWRAAHPGEMAAIDWLRQSAHGTPVVAEAAGDSYRFQVGRVATMTGLPIPIGWLLHERQFRGGALEIDVRQGDVDRIFGCSRGPIEPLQTPRPCQPVHDDPRQTEQLLEKYGVTYVYVGPTEREAYGGPGASLDRFGLFMDVAFQNGEVTIYRRRGAG